MRIERRKMELGSSHLSRTRSGMHLTFSAIVEVIQERTALKLFRSLKFTICTEVSSQ